MEYVKQSGHINIWANYNNNIRIWYYYNSFQSETFKNEIFIL